MTDVSYSTFIMSVCVTPSGLTSSFPLGSVIVAVLTMGWSQPSMRTQFPAGTLFTSIWYLDRRCRPWDLMSFLMALIVDKIWDTEPMQRTWQLKSKDGQQCRPVSPPHLPECSSLLKPWQVALPGWSHWAPCQMHGTEPHPLCCTS